MLSKSPFNPGGRVDICPIVDGMPLASIYAEEHWFRDGLPVMEHEDLCPGVLEKTQRFRSELDILSLKFQSKVKSLS